MIDLPVNVREIIGAAGGLAGVGEAGKISPMPNAADVGAADVELLTWTPRITIRETDPVGITYTRQQGLGVRVGKLVYLHANITLSSKGSAQTGYTAIIRGLPYGPAYNYHAAAVAYARGVTGSGSLRGEVCQGAGYINLYASDTSGDQVPVDFSALTDSLAIEGLSMVYIID